MRFYSSNYGSKTLSILVHKINIYALLVDRRDDIWRLDSLE